MEDEELLREAFLTDPMWRLTSGELYKIAPADGKGTRPFTPWLEQVSLYESLFEQDKKRMMFLKARRPGGSTALGIMCLDKIIFTPGAQCSLVDQTAGDAARKMERIVHVALDNLPEWIAKDIKVIKKNESHLSLSYKGQTQSDFYAGMDARGGSNDVLWISEWGVIQFEDPKRSAKIRSGGLPSARHGITVVETTWAGGKNGDVWELIDPVLKGASNDWEIRFCPWWQDPRNVDSAAIIDDTARKYFEKIKEERGMVFSLEQMRWWAKEKREQGIYMARENPTFMEECWSSPAPGSIYGESIDRARAEGRVCAMPIAGALVHTAWDLGAPRQTRCIYFQIVGEYIHIIDIDPSTDETLVQRIARMKSKHYNYGTHLFPHDAMQTKTSGYTLATEFASAWLQVSVEQLGQYDVLTGRLDYAQDYRKTGIRFVPRTVDKWVGINHGLQMFPSLKFRSPQCDEHLAVLSLYRVPTVKEGGVDNGEPVHDFSSHLADGFRTIWESHRAGLLDLKPANMIQASNKPGRPNFDPWATTGASIIRGKRFDKMPTFNRK
jgi:hypothetical protein